TDPNPPTINSIPDMIFDRSMASDTVVFKGSAVDPGFQASANYSLEAAISGTNFAESVRIFSGVSVDEIKFQVSDLNGLLLRLLPADVETSVDFRIRSILAVDAGTGAPGTSTDPFEYFSETKTATVFVYGLPRLDLIGSGVDQKIESAAGNSQYSGYVKVDPDQPFTLHNPDTDITYGGSGSVLVVDGEGIVAPGLGYHHMTADIEALTYNMEAYMIGLVGSATPNGWDAPDQKMDYNPANGTWYITLDLIDGFIKFRKNDGWAWNLGGTPEELTQGGADIPISAGNYTITLTIINDETGTCKIDKN
ncbi:MAG TPA: SusE domain-containing protein, partial [Bacteroidales bacterium]|nr:SusE domain-containing protein [Bacteroidales bacterium]